jgi:MFS family permease
VLYLQQQLGYSAVQAGLRSLALTAAMSVASTIAGRLTTVIPVRAMISGGFVLVGTGILLMTGLNDASGWTHLLPGLIVAGLGVGLVTVPLASTAVSVVDRSMAGMASGANATARQIGLAAGIAVLGSIFTQASRTGFTNGLNVILVIGGVIALACAVFSFVLIRRRDFVPPPTPQPNAAQATPVDA